MTEPDAEQRVIDMLRRLGATDADLALAPRDRSYGDLALEVMLRAGPPVPLPETATGAGLTEAEFRELWLTLGLPALEPTAPVPADLAAALPIVALAAREWLGEEVALGLTRVVGSTTARLAEALVDAYRVQFEVPSLQSGGSYAEVVEKQVELTQAGIHGFEAFITAVFRAHLVRVASGRWTPDAEAPAARRDMFVGFVDLVGYTALARTMTLGELSVLLQRFEEAVDSVVAGRGGRIVKQIGDSVMFVADTAAAGCAVALGVCQTLAEVDGLPPARVGADCGSVLARYGDYYGDVVNRAARLVALARPATVVVSDGVAAAAGPQFVFEQLPEQALKGFQLPAVSYRLLPR